MGKIIIPAMSTVVRDPLADAIQARFPGLPWLPWQKHVNAEFMKNPWLARVGIGDGSSPLTFAMGLHRRAGKDVMAFTWAVYLCYKIRNFQVIYIHKRQKDCRDLIMDQRWPKGYDGQPGGFVDSLIPKGIPRRLDKHRGVLHIGSGSRMLFTGGDRLEGRGGEYNMAIQTEAAFYKNFEKVQAHVGSSVVRNKGLNIFVSTFDGDNEYARLHMKDRHFLKTVGVTGKRKIFSIIKTCEQTRNWDGSRLVTDEDIQRLRDEGWSEERIRREFYCSMKGGAFGSIFMEQMEEMLKSGRMIDNIGLDLNQRVYTGWDFGHSRKPTVVSFWQRYGMTHRCFMVWALKGRSPDWLALRARIWSEKMQVPFARHYLAWEGNRGGVRSGRADGRTTNWVRLFREAGLRDCRPVPRVSEEEKQDVIRGFLPHCEISRNGTGRMLSALQDYRVKEKPDGGFKKKPDRDDWPSDYVDSLGAYAVCWDREQVARRANTGRYASPLDKEPAPRKKVVDLDNLGLAESGEDEYDWMAG